MKTCEYKEVFKSLGEFDAKMKPVVLAAAERAADYEDDTITVADLFVGFARRGFTPDQRFFAQALQLPRLGPTQWPTVPDSVILKFHPEAGVIIKKAVCRGKDEGIDLITARNLVSAFHDIAEEDPLSHAAQLINQTLPRIANFS